MESNTLAQEFRNAKIEVGDIVELASFTDELTKAINRVLVEQNSLMDGWLIEVTAIGEESVLAFVLVGNLIEEGELDASYKCFKLKRYAGWTEQKFSGNKVFRKIGHRLDTDTYHIMSGYRDLTNIYSRCQS